MPYITRQPHTLRPCRGDSLPTRAILLATETCREKIGVGETTMLESVVAVNAAHVRLTHGAVIGVKQEWFSPSAGFWDWVYARCCRASSTLIVGMDIYRQLVGLGLWDEFDAGRLSFIPDPKQQADVSQQEVGLSPRGCCICENPPTVIVCFVCGRRATLRIIDVRNYGVGSLADLTSAAQPAPDMYDENGQVIHGLEPKLRAECQAVRQWLESHLRLLSEKQLGSFQHTMASQGAHAWRQRYMAMPVKIHCDNGALAAERAALYGGRCECRFLGTVRRRPALWEMDYDQRQPPGVQYVDSPIVHLDVNSMYPHVMAMQEFPVEFIGSVSQPKTDWITKRLGTHLLIGEVEIDTTEPCVPLRADGVVIYPIGRFRTTLCQPEIELALDCGAKINWRRAWLYAKGDIFREMVFDLYPLRQEYRQAGQPGMADAVKRLLNSLAGKFAQKSKRWVHQPDVPSESPWSFWQEIPPGGELPENWRCMAGVVEREVIDGEHPESFPAITAFITSYARAYLWRLIRQLPEKSVFYYDTDSVHVSDLGLSAIARADLIHQDRLGAWKIVSQHRKISYYGVKKYVADGVPTWAGLPAGAVFDETKTAEWLDLESLRQGLERGEPPQAVCQTRRLTMKRGYQHGVMDRAGWVRPFREEM